MSELEIVTLPGAVLRQKTKRVKTFGPELQQLIDDMIETMRAAPGVGLAAPQVGRSLRLAVVETPPEVDEEGNEIEDSQERFVLVNPEIMWKSGETVDGIEGCLSIPGYVGEVNRHESVRVRTRDRHGKKIRLDVEGWTARIFQHEIDHLNGVLYIDRLTAPENFWTEEEYYGEPEEEETGEAAETPAGL